MQIFLLMLFVDLIVFLFDLYRGLKNHNFQRKFIYNRLKFVYPLINIIYNRIINIIIDYLVMDNLVFE